MQSWVTVKKTVTHNSTLLWMCCCQPISRSCLYCLFWSLSSCSLPITGHSTHVQDSWREKSCGHGPEESWTRALRSDLLTPHSKQQAATGNQHWLKHFVCKWNKPGQPNKDLFKGSWSHEWGVRNLLDRFLGCEHADRPPQWHPCHSRVRPSSRNASRGGTSCCQKLQG